MIYFHPTEGFFDSNIHKSIPGGAIEITTAEHHRLLSGQAAGKRIVQGSEGKPHLVDAPPPPIIVPPAVSRFQARMALRNAGLFEAAEAAVAASGDPLLMEAWDSAVEYRRLSPSILTLGAALQLDDAAIDQLFRDAAEITA